MTPDQWASENKKILINVCFLTWKYKTILLSSECQKLMTWADFVPSMAILCDTSCHHGSIVD